MSRVCRVCPRFHSRADWVETRYFKRFLKLATSSKKAKSFSLWFEHDLHEQLQFALNPVSTATHIDWCEASSMPPLLGAVVAGIVVSSNDGASSAAAAPFAINALAHAAR